MAAYAPSVTEMREDAAAAAGRGRGAALGRLRAWLVAAPAYPANAADLRSVDVLGLRLPVRATIAIVTVTLILLLDYHGRIDGLVACVLGAPETARGAQAGAGRRAAR